PPAPPRRGIELALPGLARPAGKPTQETVEAEIDEIEEAPAATRARRRTAAATSDAPSVEGVEGVEGVEVVKAAGPRTRRKAAAVVAPAEPVGAATTEPMSAPAPARARR